LVDGGGNEEELSTKRRNVIGGKTDAVKEKGGEAASGCPRGLTNSTVAHSLLVDERRENVFD